MTAPHGVLLRPESPEVFEPGPCGGRCPTALWTGSEWIAGPVTVAGSLGCPMAVALAWGGSPLHYGIAAAMTMDDCFNPNHLLLDLLAILEDYEEEQTRVRLAQMVEYLAEYGLGTLVLVDKHGKELTC